MTSVYGTLARVLIGLIYIYDEIIEAQKQNDNLVSDEYTAGLEAARGKVMKYFDLTKQSLIYFAVVTLNSVTRTFWFEDHWAGYDKGSWIKLVTRRFRDLFDVYAIAHAMNEPTSQSIEEEQENNVVIKKDKYKRWTGLSPAFIVKKRKRVNTNVTADEFVRYT